MQHEVITCVNMKHILMKVHHNILQYYDEPSSKCVGGSQELEYLLM